VKDYLKIGKLKISHLGYFFLSLMVANIVITNALRIFGISILYTNTTRIFVILQILGIAVIAWVLGWVKGSKEDKDDKS
jgi:threonine/homoserine/homoserine lactone efflux protein